MSPDVQQGVNAELGFILKTGWVHAPRPYGFDISPPPVLAEQQDGADQVIDEVWRIARFIAYSQFVSIERLGDGTYVVKSRSAPNLAFQLHFLPLLAPDL